MTAEYARKGEKLLFKSQGAVVGSDGKLGVSSNSTSCYDGKLFRTTGGDGKVVTISRKVPRTVNPQTKYNGEEVLLRLLPLLQAKSYKPETMSITFDAPKGVPGAASHVRIVYGNNQASDDVWFLPAESGYGVCRLESRSGGNLFHEYSDCAYQQIEGVYCLTSALYKNYYHKENIHQVAQSQRYKVEKITFNPEDVQDSLFEIPTSTETHLIDRDLGDRVIRDPAEVEKHIRKAGQEAGEEKGSGRWWWKWASLGGSAVLLLGAVFVLVRIRKRRPTTTDSTGASGSSAN
jgi:hypothetical protein